MKRSTWAVTAIVLTAAGSGLASGAAALPTGTNAAGAGAAPLAWTECDADAHVADPAMRCAEVTVPLDYLDPNGRSLRIALVKMPAQGTRRGAVLYNPGGPGGSGFDQIAAAGDRFQKDLGLRDFDMIGFDPRGVGRSGSIHCVDQATAEREVLIDSSPDNEQEAEALDRADQAFFEGCRRNYGFDLRYYSTVNTARDMDRIRAALGDEQLTFLGISYGTYLGGTYATLYPDRVRAMVLDSAYEPNDDSPAQERVTQLKGFEEAFNHWAAWCAAADDCPFKARDIGGRWDRLVSRLRTDSLTVGDRIVEDAVVHSTTVQAMYSTSTWFALAQALADADHGDGRGLLSLADRFTGRRADGTYEDLNQASPVIRCASGIQALREMTRSEAVDLLRWIRAEAPRFGRDVTIAALMRSDVPFCEYLIGESVGPLAIHYAGPAPILVLGGLGDPATPMRWSRELVERLGPSARLVTYTGDGHGQTLRNRCVTSVEGRVLALAEMPPPALTCTPDPAVERPSWLDDLAGGLALAPPTPALLRLVGLGPERAATVAVTIDANDADGHRTLAAFERKLDRRVFRPTTAIEPGRVPGSSQLRGVHRGGDRVLIVAFGKDALRGADLAPFATAIPDGQVLLVVARLAD